MKFNELIKLLERSGFKLLKEKGSIRYYSKPDMTGSFVSIIMARRRFRRALIMLF
jgi:predicted RNA binding protein YcfA (HicA-like mRNA interferase family)